MPTNPYAPKLGSRNPKDVIASTPGRLEQLVQTLGPQRVNQPWSPGKWSPRQILCHLADCELVFAYRIRQGLSQDHHVIQPFDQDKWADPYGVYDAATALAAFTSMRRWNLALIHSLTAAELQKPINHPERGEMTLQTVVETMGGHDLNHLAQVEAAAGKSQSA